jgi:hypothetical protein
MLILKIFSPNNLAKILPFSQTTAGFCKKKMIITLVFEKNAIFIAENEQKSQKNCDHNIDPRLDQPSPVGEQRVMF